MNIVALGTPAQKIALEFKNIGGETYSLFAIDSSVKEKTSFQAVYDTFPEYDIPEDYENVFVKNDPKWDEFVEGAKSNSGDFLFIIVGGGNISLSSLRILQYFRDRKIKILFIRPDTSMITGQQRLQERAVFGILQEYARSGNFEDIILVSNEKIQKSLEDISFAEFYNRINNVIASVVHGSFAFSAREPVFGNLGERNKIARISTVGALNLSTNEEMLLYDLTSTREVMPTWLRRG